MSSTQQTLGKRDAEQDEEQDGNFLSQCSSAFMARMSQHFEKQVFLEGATLFQEGEDPGMGCIVHQGHASLEIGGVVVGKVGPGEFLGELLLLGLIDGSTVSVRATSRVVAFCINREQFAEVLSEFPQEWTNMSEVLQKRMDEQKEHERKIAAFAPMKRALMMKGGAAAKFFDLATKKPQHTSIKVTAVEERATFEPKKKAKQHLPGHSSGIRWAQGRRKAVKNAEFVRWARAQRNVPQPLPPIQGYRAKDSGHGTPYASVTDLHAKVPAPGLVRPGLLRLKKSADLYGRKVWKKPHKLDVMSLLRAQACVGESTDSSSSSSSEDSLQEGGKEEEEEEENHEGDTAEELEDAPGIDDTGDKHEVSSGGDIQEEEVKGDLDLNNLQASLAEDENKSGAAKGEDEAGEDEHEAGEHLKEAEKLSDFGEDSVSLSEEVVDMECELGWETPELKDRVEDIVLEALPLFMHQ